jgi:hypothetical protein
MSWNNVYTHDDCGICMEQYNIQDNITWFPCNHCVCLKCYLKCNTCPICRAPFDTNIKPPIFKTIHEITTQIETNLSNNIIVNELEIRIHQLRSLL